MRVLALLVAMAALPAVAETLALWPEGRTPDFQAHQTVPTLTVDLPAKRTTDAIMLVEPGGSYMKCVAWEAACTNRFLSRGMATALLTYRTPRPKGLPKHASAWADAQRAVRLVRANAGRWGVDLEKICVIGFSAGGNLAIRTATSSQTPAYARVDEVDDLPCHVNGAIVCYPAYVLSDCKNFDGGNRQKGDPLDLVFDPTFSFDAKTPPMCMLHGDEDAHSPMGSVRLYHKLRTMGISAELHVYAGRRHADLPSSNCWQLMWDWLAKTKSL